MKCKLMSFIHSFIPFRRTRPKTRFSGGDQFVFLAIERNTKLILHWSVGKRTKPHADQFARSLKQRLSGDRFQVTTDCFPVYFGRQGAITSTFGNTVDYGTEYKKFGYSTGDSRARLWDTAKSFGIINS